MKKKLLYIIPIIIVILFSIIFPVVKWKQAEGKNTEVNKQQESIIIESSFYSTYGQKAEIKNFVRPEDLKIYGVLWADDGYIHTSLWINGVWVEIAKQELLKD